MPVPKYGKCAHPKERPRRMQNCRGPFESSSPQWATRGGHFCVCHVLRVPRVACCACRVSLCVDAVRSVACALHAVAIVTPPASFALDARARAANPFAASCRPKDAQRSLLTAPGTNRRQRGANQRAAGRASHARRPAPRETQALTRNTEAGPASLPKPCVSAHTLRLAERAGHRAQPGGCQEAGPHARARPRSGHRGQLPLTVRPVRWASSG